MAHPLAPQLRNLQTLAELGVEKNTTVVFPAPMMSAIGEITSFLTRETAAAQGITTPPAMARGVLLIRRRPVVCRIRTCRAVSRPIRHRNLAFDQPQKRPFFQLFWSPSTSLHSPDA